LTLLGEEAATRSAHEFQRVGHNVCGLRASRSSSKMGAPIELLEFTDPKHPARHQPIKSSTNPQTQDLGNVRFADYSRTGLIPEEWDPSSRHSIRITITSRGCYQHQALS